MAALLFAAGLFIGLVLGALGGFLYSIDKLQAVIQRAHKVSDEALKALRHVSGDIDLLNRLEVQLRDHRQSHVSWVDHYQAHADGKSKCRQCTPDVIAAAGNQAHQKKVIADYDWMIAGVQRLRSQLAGSMKP